MECLECVSRLWEYLDGELEAEEVLAMHCHLAGCTGCRPAYECDRNFLALLARCALRKPASSPTLQESVRLKLALIR
jgi:anti-sigma factor RsiW